MSYIAVSDITDSVVLAFGSTILATYITRSDTQVEDVAEQLGVRDTTSIETDPVHAKIKEYAVAWLCMTLFEDKAMYNNTDFPDQDKYYLKYQMYEKKVKRLRGELSVSMFLGQVDEIRDRANRAFTLFRGD